MNENEVIDKYGGVTLDDGTYIPMVGGLEILLFSTCFLLLWAGIPLVLYLTTNESGF